MNNYKKTIIDVRSPEEFKNGNVAGSINIPLNEIQQRIEEIKKLPYPLILCCASGNRSGQAAASSRQRTGTVPAPCDRAAGIRPGCRSLSRRRGTGLLTWAGNQTAIPGKWRRR